MKYVPQCAPNVTIHMPLTHPQLSSGTNKQEEIAHNHQVLIGQVWTWCGMLHSLLGSELLDEELGIIGRCCNPTGKTEFLLLPNECLWKPALIQTGYTELLLKEHERTKEETGNVNFKRARLRRPRSVALLHRRSQNGCKSISSPAFTVIKILKRLKWERRVKRVEICFDNIIHNSSFALCELITLHLQTEEKLAWYFQLKRLIFKGLIDRLGLGRISNRLEGCSCKVKVTAILGERLSKKKRSRAETREGGSAEN